MSEGMSRGEAAEHSTSISSVGEPILLLLWERAPTGTGSTVNLDLCAEPFASAKRKE